MCLFISTGQQRLQKIKGKQKKKQNEKYKKTEKQKFQFVVGYQGISIQIKLKSFCCSLFIILNNKDNRTKSFQTQPHTS